MNPNVFTHPFAEVPDPSAQPILHSNLLSNLIQGQSQHHTIPTFIEKYNEHPSNYLSKYLEFDPKSKNLKNVEPLSPRYGVKNEKDPRFKADFYLEKPFISRLEPEIETLEEKPDIFKQDFIGFDREKPDLNDEKFAINSKRIKKFKNARAPEKKGQESPQYKTFSESIPNKTPNEARFIGEKAPPAQIITPLYEEARPYQGKDITELIDNKHKKLLIFSRCKVILENIEREQVVVISGDTGCGKSTQVPKYIYLDARSKGKRVKIICTQPRRMAALNLAKRVAFELGESLGGVVGYQISLDSRQTNSTAILYVTNGIFLQSLIHDMNLFNEVTHVILDEIHERDIDSDFTMIAMKHLLKENPQLKLLLMSATINTQLFVNYFSKSEIENCHTKEYNYELNANAKKWEKLSNWEDYDPKAEALKRDLMAEENIPWSNIQIKTERDPSNQYGSSRRVEGQRVDSNLEQYNIHMNDSPACHIEIPNREERNPRHPVDSYKVEIFFIDTVEKFLGKQLANGIEFRYIDFDRKKPNLHIECVQLALEIVKSILARDEQEKQRYSSNNTRGFYPRQIDGSILIFLPGLNEINGFILKLEESLTAHNLEQLKIIPLHSALPDSQNEQIFERRETGKRKIIVSTNIAESSITVPDIVYVIDFCLSKETNYNPYNSMEKLELCWASRASAKQRAGRTGRVCNGFCFRLVPEIFFTDHLLAFTTPELLRSPLDKLILRIKTINENDPKKLFTDPQKVLGRAIQPPHIDNISFALKSLQDAGALTWSIDKSYKSCRITQIGKIYCDLPCDIRVCKLCIMGFVFNCLQESVTIAAILQHQKTMFILNSRVSPRDQSKFYKNISGYDRCSNSDLILMLNIFNEWEERFGCLERITRMQSEFSSDNTFNAKFLKREFKRHGAQEDEKKWCRDNYLDPIVLREILIQREDIKQRLRKFNFQENHYKSGNRDNQTTYLKLKILFAASFNNNFLKAYQKWDMKLEKKLFNLKTSFNINTKCALIVTYSGFNAENLTPQQLANKESEWKDFFQNYGVVEKVKFNYNEAYITFKENGSEEAIKYLLYKKAINNSLRPINKEENAPEKKPSYEGSIGKKKGAGYSFEEEEKKFLESIGAFDYLHLCQFNDLLRSHPVQIDNDSINKFVFSNTSFVPNTSSHPFTNPFRKQDTILPEQRQEPRILICFDYQERNNNKHYTRYTTLLPDFPLLASVLLLIFSALPALKVSSDKSRYEKIMIDEHEVSLDHFLTEKDIEDINNLRAFLRDNLTAEALSKAPTDSFWNLLMEILTRERVKYYEPEVWEDAFKNQTKNTLIFDNLLNQNNAKKTELQCVAKFLRTQGRNVGNQGTNTENKKIVEYQIYLPNIEKPPLEYSSNFSFDISREEGKLMYKMYQESYNQWKLKILDDINTHKKFLELKQTFLACARCKLPITDIKNLKEKDPDIFFLRKLIPNPYDVSTLNFNADDEFCSSEQYFEVDELFGKDLEFYGCRNDHIVGIRPKNVDPNDWFIYITEHSNLIVLYPDLTEEVFDFFNFDMKRTLELENFKFKKKKQIILDMRYDCQICQEFQMAGAEFLIHIKEGRKHKETLKEFQASLKKPII